METSEEESENTHTGVTQEDRERAKKLYPNQTFDNKDLEVMKALGHL